MKGQEPSKPGRPGPLAPQVKRLWPDGAPRALGKTPNDSPTLEIYLPEAATSVGTGVVIFPGGGYGNLADGHEGQEIARWLNRLGIAAFVCKYRHQGRGYGHPAPLEDAQRAIRMVRAGAETYQIKPDRVWDHWIFCGRTLSIHGSDTFCRRETKRRGSDRACQQPS